MATRESEIPEVFSDGFLFEPARYKVAWGGRGSGKSWAFARALIAKAHTGKVRILCAREFMTSMADSVHKLLADQIEEMGLAPWFAVQKASITSLVTGSEFLFKGLRHNIQEIKSTEGCDIAWVEEAQSVSEESWRILVPTIRNAGSEIWVSFNPGEDTDPTYKRFVVNPPPGALVRKVGWQDNPWFPVTLDVERRYMLATDEDAYAHVWDGHCRRISEATIFRGRVSVETFAAPDDARFYFGADWGFAADPTVLVRCWIRDECLYVDHEAYGVGVELDDIAEKIFDRVPGSRDWPIKADNARPETISYVRRAGFNIDSAKKWPGSVEDGVAHLKGFKRIIVHERCKHTAEEFRLYSYKVDRTTGDVLPIIVDRWNHTIDSLRYALSGYIRSRGNLSVWERMLDD